jgi:GINS complex subunit 1
MLCDTALKLVADAQRAQQTDVLRPYAEELVRNVSRETRVLETQLVAGQDVLSQIESDDSAICGLTVAALCMKRNKRCLLAYHAHRLDQIKDRFWDGGASAHALLAPDRLERDNLSPGEVDFVRAYSKLVTQYKSAYLDMVDIASPTLQRPPRDLYVQVRVMKDVGEIVGEWGVLDLKKNDLLSVMRPDVERLIVAGVRDHTLRLTPIQSLIPPSIL